MIENSFTSRGVVIKDYVTCLKCLHSLVSCVMTLFRFVFNALWCSFFTLGYVCLPFFVCVHVSILWGSTPHVWKLLILLNLGPCGVCRTLRKHGRNICVKSSQLKMRWNSTLVPGGSLGVCFCTGVFKGGCGPSDALKQACSAFAFVCILGWRK